MGSPGTEPHAEWRGVSSGYFSVLGIPMVSGRIFSKRDDANAQPVVIINEALARRYYPNEDPIGKLIQTPTAPELFLRPKQRRMTIVGIVADVEERRAASRTAARALFPLSGRSSNSTYWRT